MPSKYDTNPLEPDFPEKVKREAETRDFGGGETRPFAPESEEPTRIFSPEMATAYSPPTQFYQNSISESVDQSIGRRVAKIGLPENILTAVPYIPWFFGFIAGLVLLLLLPKSEAKVRFHAAQGLAAHLAIFGVAIILGIVEEIVDFGNAAEAIFQIVTSIMLVVFAYRAFRGKPIHIEAVEDLTNYLEEKIGPVKA